MIAQGYDRSNDLINRGPLYHFIIQQYRQALINKVSQLDWIYGNFLLDIPHNSHLFPEVWSHNFSAEY